jgi:hypothetical protein
MTSRFVAVIFLFVLPFAALADKERANSASVCLEFDTQGTDEALPNVIPTLIFIDETLVQISKIFVRNPDAGGSYASLDGSGELHLDIDARRLHLVLEKNIRIEGPFSPVSDSAQANAGDSKFISRMMGRPYLCFDSRIEF